MQNADMKNNVNINWQSKISIYILYSTLEALSHATMSKQLKLKPKFEEYYSTVLVTISLVAVAEVGGLGKLLG